MDQASVPWEVAPAGTILVAMIICADSASIREVESLVLIPMGMPGDTVARVGTGMEVPLREMNTVLETPDLVPVDTSEGTVISSVAEVVCWDVMLSCGCGAREDFGCV